MFTKIWKAFSEAQTIWGFIPSSWQIAVLSAVSTVTGVFGYQGGGLFLALLGAAAMFAFGTAGMYYATLFNNLTSIFERIIIESVAVVQASIGGGG